MYFFIYIIVLQFKYKNNPLKFQSNTPLIVYDHGKLNPQKFILLPTAYIFVTDI